MSYCFNIKSSLEDNASKEKISDEEKSTILEKCYETIAWLDKNQSAEVEEFKEKQSHLEKIFNPIIQKLYTNGQNGQTYPTPGGCGAESGQGFGGNNYGGPTVEEVD